MAYSRGQWGNALHTVVETPEFLRDAKVAGIGADERSALVGFIASRPDAGDPIPGTGGARKLRWRRPGSVAVTASLRSTAVRRFRYFLLNVFAKGDKVNLSAAERNELRSILSELAAEYRRGMRRDV